MKYLLTYEDALKLVEKYDNFNFSKSETEIDGYKVVTFTYFLCEYAHFERPLIDSDIKGYDMRGATFVFNKDGSLFRNYYMLSKFFNLNQVESTQYDLVKDKKIKSITEKADGSLIAFMQLPNGKVFAKTIGGFSNDQVAEAMKLYDNDELLKNFIIDIFDLGLTPLFEFVSRSNRIVLKYGKPELRLIGARCNKSTQFYTAKEILTTRETDIKRVENFNNLLLDELIKLGKTTENIEGWVIEFEDGQMIKIKTDWYFNRHGLRTVNIFREDYVIKNYLEGKLDDILAQLDPNDDDDAFKFVEKVISAVDNYILYIDEQVKTLVDEYYDFYKEDWAKFATEKHADVLFGLSKTKIETIDKYNDRKVQHIINKTKKLDKSKFFVDEWTDIKDEIINKWRGN